MMLFKLIHHWQLYTAAMARRPYDPDHVQAYGLLFASTWKDAKPEIARLMGITPDEVEYSMKHDFMATLIPQYNKMAV